MMDKTYNSKDVEAKHYQLWEKSGANRCDVTSNKDAYTIMIPPPNVTGSLHMGHALNQTIQDVLIRYKRKKGLDALWQPGKDHAGIATQMVVERQLAEKNITRHDLGREKFLEKVWEWKEESGSTISNQARKLGVMPDWPRERFTMDEGMSAAVRKVFVQLHKEGLIYRDKRLVNWDPKLHTAISDIEVVQKEVKGSMWHFRYPLEEDSSRYIVVATTRPETMLGDTAVAVNPKDERYTDLIGKNVILPLVGRKIAIIADDYADPEQGSGAVKITPAHDFNDYEVGKRNDLEVINIFDHNACLNDSVPDEYKGMERYEAREKIIEDLDKLGLVDKIEDHVLMVPFGDRSDVVIEPWLTDQWFADAKTLAKPAIEAVKEGKTKFVPQRWENTYYEWMENIQPWCISRQLWWGHQIPAWFADDGTIFVEETEEEAFASAKKHFGKSVNLKREEDVLDTWFSSALWPFSTLGWPEETPELERYFPGDVLVTAFDIIFFWVARMMMMSMHFMGEVPFHTVYMHALVLDEHGKKMSKSKGNVIDPLVLVDKYGADALRFTLLSQAAQGRDIRLAENRVEGNRNFATKLWNAARYAEMNECKLQAEFEPSEVKLTVNKWIISALIDLEKATSKSIDDYRFNDAAMNLYHFIWGRFCDWYLEFTKPILKGDDEAAKAETRAVTAYILEHILHYLHPLMPSLTEEIYGSMVVDEGKKLMCLEWPEIDADLYDSKSLDEMDWAIKLISAVRSLRSDMNISPALHIPLLLKTEDTKTIARLESQKALLMRLARLEKIEILDADAPKGAAESVLDEASIILPLAGLIDIDKERARLAKELKKHEVEIIKIDKKLGNEHFLAKAPEAVVAEQKSRREAAIIAQSKLNDALGRLAEI